MNIKDFFEEGKKRGFRFCEGDYEHALFLTRAKEKLLGAARKKKTTSETIHRYNKVIFKLLMDGIEENNHEYMAEAVILATTIGYILGKGGKLLDDMLKYGGGL